MADCEYTIAGDDRVYSESEFKKLLSEGYLDKVMIENKIKIRNIKPNEELAKIFQMPATIQTQAPTETKDNYKIAQDVTSEVSRENPDASVLLTPKGEDLSLTAVYVGKENRGKGIGTKVLESVKKQADKLGKKIVLDATTELDEETDLGRLESFYQNNGFTKVGENKFEYNPTEQAATTEDVTKTEEKVTEPAFEKGVEIESTPEEWLDKLPVLLDKGFSQLKEVPVAEPRVVEYSDKVEYTYLKEDSNGNEYNFTVSINKRKDGSLGSKVTTSTTIDGEIAELSPTAEKQESIEELNKRKESLNKEFNSLNKQYVKDSKQLDVATRANEDTTVIEERLDNTQQRMSEISSELEGVEDKIKTTETKQPTREAVAAKNMADILRKAKIKMEGGTAMASFLPGFENVWNGSIETVSKAIELGGITAGNFRQSIEAGMKALKQTDAYKAITDPKERAKISARYKKILTSAYSEGYNIDTDNLREAEFNDFNQKLEESKGKTLSNKEFNALKAEAKKFVNDNLPADSYKKSEVQSYVRNNFDKAKTVEDIQKNLDKVNGIMTTKEAKIETAEAKQAEKDRKATIKEIINITKPTSPKMISKNRRTGVKKANVSLDALRQINEMRDQGLFDKDNLESKTKEELDALKEQIQNIQAKGRAEKKSETKEKKEVKKSSESLILETLDKPNATLNSEEEILDFMERRNGVVVVDGQVMSKSAFKEFAKENEGKDYTGTKFYINKDTELKEQKQEKKGVLKTARKYTMAAIRDLDTYMKDISKGSKELRDWTKENILDPTKKAIYNKVKNTAKFKGEYRDAVKNIFGGFSSAIDYLSKDSGISTDVSDLEGVKAKKINRDQAVHIYGLINNPDAKKAEKNIERLKSKNNIDTDKVKALVEGDPKLMAYYNFLREMYDKKFREEFGSTIENLYGIPLDKGYYWPEPAGVSETLELNLEGFSNKELSMIAPNMRQRDPKYNGPFELANSYDVYNRYVESMVHAKEFIPVIENSRILLSDVNRPRVLDKLNDTNKYNDLIDLMKVVFTDKSPYKSSSMDFLANYTAVKTLWLRLKAIPQQASALLNYYNAGWVDGINPAQIVASVVPKNATELDFALDFYKDNPYLWERLKGASNQDMKAIETQVDTIVSELGKKVIDKALFAALSPIKAGDFVATSTPFGGGAFAMAQFKKRFKDNGGDYQDAKDFALQRWFEETERTQQPAIDKSIVSTAAYDPMYRFLVPFVSAQNSMGKKIVKSAKDIQDWKNLTKQEKNQAVADMLYYTVVGSIPFSLMSGSLLTALDVFDEEDEEARGNMFDRLSFDLLADNVMSNIQSLYFVGFATNLVLNEMRGREYFNERPQGETINSFAKFVSSFAMASSDWDFLTEEMKKDYFNRFKLKGKELEEFNALPEDEKIDYLRKNAVETGIISNDEESIRKFKEEYSNKWRFNRMGKEGMDSFLKLTGIDKPMNLYRDIANYIDENGTFEELIYGEGAGTTEEAEPFSKNVPKQFFDAISYKRGNQLFKMYSDVLGEPEEYYDIYPSKPGGPISNPVSEPDVNQSEKEVQGVMIKRKRPGLRGIQYGD
jgi:GNAT superfamily N-acetyltransferase